MIVYKKWEPLHKIQIILNQVFPTIFIAHCVESSDTFEFSAESEGKIIQEEENNLRPLDLELFKKYFAASGHKNLFLVVIFFCVFSQLVKIGNDYWLVYWTSDDNVTPDFDTFSYLGKYFLR